MDRYFFHLRIGEDFEPDEDGATFLTAADAVAEAGRRVEALVAERRRLGEDDRVRIEVAGADRFVIGIVDSEAVTEGSSYFRRGAR